MANKNMLNLNDDSINRAMVDGLCNAFRSEIKATLMDVAEKEVDSIVESVSKRMEARLYEAPFDMASFDRKIKIEWLLRKEDEPPTPK